jgi:single-strand DNA-binding protein
MNKIIIAGRLARDPELRACNSGTEVCNFTVAVDRRFSAKGEEKQCDFIDCSAWGKTGVFVNQYFHKGDGITIEGRMESRKWVDKDGNNRISWGVTCDNVEFPLGKGKGVSDGSDSGLPFAMGGGEFKEIEGEEDLPF